MIQLIVLLTRDLLLSMMAIEYFGFEVTREEAGCLFPILVYCFYTSSKFT